MYSRRFNDHNVMPPPDYGGVTYRTKEEDKEMGTGLLPQPDRMPSEEKVRTTASPKGSHSREERRIRRPLYRSPKVREEVRSPAEKDRENEKGLLSGLFSLTGRKFSMEDIVLAGLILLMMSDRGKESTDGEILLILGLLLLTK